MQKTNTKLWLFLLLLALSLIGAATSFAADKNIYFRGIAPLSTSENAEIETNLEPASNPYTETTPLFPEANQEAQTYENIAPQKPPEREKIKSVCQPSSLPVIKQGKIIGCAPNK